jgi:hypothetical protein
VTEHGVVVEGVEYEVDCLIFATGFEVGTAYTRRAEFELYGRNGVRLTDAWAKGMRTYHGFLSHGFPNCFHMGLTQTGLAPNFTYLIEGQAQHIAQLISEVNARKAVTIEPTPEAVAEWVECLDRVSKCLHAGLLQWRGAKHGGRLCWDSVSSGCALFFQNARSLARTGGF